MARPRKDEGRTTRQDILDRALDLFAEHGYYGTSMREIARAVGVRESALYNHFKSKGAILEELLAVLGPGQATQLAGLEFGPLVEAMGAEGVLKLITETMITIWSTPHERKIFRLMMSEGPRLDADGVVHPAQLMRRAREVLSGFFIELGKRKLIRKVDPMAATMGLLGPMVALRFAYLAMPSEETNFKALKVEVDAHVRFFWEAVKP